MIAWTPALFLLVTAPEAAVDDLAADARAAYEKTLRGELEAAEGLYASVIARGADTADLYFDLGTVQLERGALVDAVVSFERALRRSPGHEAARTNLEIARSRLNAVPAERAPSLADALPAAASFGWTGWALLLVFGNALLAAAVALPRSRLAWAGAGGVTAVVGLTGLLFLGWAAQRPEAVLRATTALRSGPAERYESSGEVPAGTTVRPIDRREDWIEVRLPDGRQGWIPEDRSTRL